MAGRDVVRKEFAVMLGRDITVLRAGGTLTLVTLLATIAGGILMYFADHQTFPTVWRGLWWAVQTVTTVGYGDVVPRTIFGRLVATFVMLSGIAFISVFTAIVTATFIESARRRLAPKADDPTEAKLDEISTRLAALEAAVKSRPD